MTAEGQVDFYILFKKWGVELLRDGNRLEEHSGRFSQPGLYGTTLTVDDYIILDCRNTQPRRRHDIPKLHHVIFSKDYQEISILDHLLRPIDAGKLRLAEKLTEKDRI